MEESGVYLKGQPTPTGGFDGDWVEFQYSACPALSAAPWTRPPGHAAAWFPVLPDRGINFPAPSGWISFLENGRLDSEASHRTPRPQFPHLEHAPRQSS